MKPFFRVLFVLQLASLVLATYAKADSVLAITYADIRIGPNLTGDQVESTMSGPHASFFGEGGASCDFCNVGGVFLPGQTVSASAFIEPFIVVFSAQIVGTTYTSTQLSFGSTDITSGVVTIPSGSSLPQEFTVSLPATIGDLHGEILIAPGQPFTLVIHPGKLELTFDLVPAQSGNPAYYQYSGGEFVTTPELSTWVLFGTGVVLIGFLHARASKGQKTAH